MQKTNIDWPGLTHTWNPVTGCLRNCWYCYAHKIHNRFNKTPFSKIVFHENRIADPLEHKKPAVIFVGSMSDNEYWGNDETEWILDVCAKCPQHKFMFLSKGVYSYHIYVYPSNTMQGLTLDLSQPAEVQAHALAATESIMMPDAFLSIEPLLGPLHVPIPDNVKLVIVGAMTGQGAIAPKPEWVDSIKKRCPPEKLYFKKSMPKSKERK